MTQLAYILDEKVGFQQHIFRIASAYSVNVGYAQMTQYLKFLSFLGSHQSLPNLLPAYLSTYRENTKILTCSLSS